jgi:hypothetical protein
MNANTRKPNKLSEAIFGRFVKGFLKIVEIQQKQEQNAFENVKTT